MGAVVGYAIGWMLAVAAALVTAVYRRFRGIAFWALVPKRARLQSSPVIARWSLVVTWVFLIGTAMAHLQWRWGEDLAGQALGAGAASLVLTPCYLAVAVMVLSVVLVVTARRGFRLEMIRHVREPILTVVCSVCVVVGMVWLTSSFPRIPGWFAEWASPGMSVVLAAGTIVLGVLLLIGWFCVLKDWLPLMARHAFRASDAHVMLPAAALLGATAITGTVTIVGVIEQGLEPAFPWPVAILLTAVPSLSAAVMAVVEIVAFARRSLSWRLPTI